MTINRDGQKPDTYQGLNPVQNPPIIKATRAPTTLDRRHKIGTTWIDTSANQAWFLTSVVAGSATWALASPGASDVDTLTGDVGGAISPAAGNITLAGGTNIGTSGAGSTITFNLDAAITLATSVTTPLLTSSGADLTITADAGQDVDITAPAGQDIVIKMGDAAGANKVSFTDDADVEVAAIDSNGGFTMGAITFTGLLTASASATIDTAGTTLSLATDNSGDAVILGGGTVARAITIGQDAAAHTIAIGQAAAGAITLDTAAGISLDSATASNFTVTGAADLTLASTAGSMNVTAGEAAADAIVINASDGAGGVQIQAGTGGILIGNQADCTTIDVGDIAPTASRTITVGGGTVVTASVTDTIDIGPDGATTNADSIKTVNVNTGGVTTGEVLTNIATGAITSGTHTVLIQSGNVTAGTVTTGISTGTGTKTVGIGNGDGNTTLNISAITNINASVNANTALNTGTSTGTVTIGNAAAGAITADTAAGISLDGATASNFTVTGAGQDLTLASAGGSVLVSSTEDAALAIRLHANGGTSETIQLHADQGTGVDSIDLLSDVGGITFTSTGLASDDAINLAAVAGGVDIDAAMQINIASSENTADAIVINSSAGGIDITAAGAAAEDIDITCTAGSLNISAGEAAADAIVIDASDAAGGITLTAGTGNVGITGCNLVLDSVATQIEMNGGAVTDFIGQATLVNGQVTVANTNIAANDRILLTRSAINASTALGHPLTTISAGASFTIEAKQAATPGSDETGDLSTFDYVIIREN